MACWCRLVLAGLGSIPDRLAVKGFEATYGFATDSGQFFSSHAAAEIASMLPVACPSIFCCDALMRRDIIRLSIASSSSIPNRFIMVLTISKSQKALITGS